MTRSASITTFLLILISFTFYACGGDYPDDILIFTNATIWNGTESAAIENAALVTHNGTVLDIIEMNDPDFPEEAETVDLDGRYIVPGLINAHGHVGVARGLDRGEVAASRENVMD